MATWGLAASVLLFASQATAQGTAPGNTSLAGKWRQGPLKEDFTVQQWIGGCGPAPVSGHRGGGEAVTVREEGDELVFSGPDGTFRTNGCFDPLPTLRRESHSREGSGRVWRTKCVTPAGDPRRAIINTLVAATAEGRIEVTETGRYEITLAEGRCIADIRRSRAYDAIRETPPATTATATADAPPKPAAEPKTCEHPGDPARLEVRPSRKLLRAGDSFAFHSIVRDAQGCVLADRTTWTVTGAPRSVTVDGSGMVRVAAGAPEGPVEIVASVAGKSAKVSLEVAAPGHYEELLGHSGLNAAGESEAAAVAVLEGASLGAGDATAEDGAKRRKSIFLGIVGLLATALGVAALVGVRRARRARALEADVTARHAEQVRDHEARQDARVREHAAQMRAHLESVEQAKAAEAKAKDRERQRPRGPARTGPMMSCPKCRREFADGTTAFCPHDGTKLASGGAAPSTEGAPVGTAGVAGAAPRGKICPTCGGRFEGAATFCGKDGTALVLLN